MLYPHGAPDAFLEGATTRRAALSRDAHGPRAVLNALDRLAGTYDAQAATARKDLAIAEGQLRDYQAPLGQPFTHDAYLAELTSLRDELKAALSEAAPERQSLPPAAETARRIQALKAAHVVEATLERPPTRSTRTAEEPVTTRIRRRRRSPRVAAHGRVSSAADGAVRLGGGQRADPGCGTHTYRDFAPTRPRVSD